MDLRFRKGDILAIAAVLALAAAVFALFLPFRSTDGAVVEIYRNGERLHAFSLNVDRQFTIDGDYTNVVTISGGKVAITESTCPGGDCVARGAISRPGESIVCLPARVTVAITGGSGSADVVVG